MNAASAIPGSAARGRVAAARWNPIPSAAFFASHPCRAPYDRPIMPPDPEPQDVYHRLHRDAGAVNLAVLGGFHPAPDEAHLPPGCATLVVLGPAEPGFWPAVTAAPEFRDGRGDPLDRWSRRVVGALAAAWDATALFPFDGPPWLPFPTWTKRCGRAWDSPVSLLVHADAGLMASVRGALALRQRISVPASARRPCDDCRDRLCVVACPVGALTTAGYDIALCRRHLDSPAGAGCRSEGCGTRRACPISRAYPRLPAQSAFHMQAFHPVPCDT